MPVNLNKKTLKNTQIPYTIKTIFKGILLVTKKRLLIPKHSNIRYFATTIPFV